MPLTTVIFILYVFLLLITCCKICYKGQRYWRKKERNVDEIIVFFHIILQGVIEVLFICF